MRANSTMLCLLGRGVIYPALLVLLLFAGYAWAAADDCEIVDTAIKITSRIRGLKFTRKVGCRLEGQEEVKRYLEEQIEKKISPEKLSYEGEVYKLLGLIPSDFEYKDGLIELYVSQLGGYYDPEKKYYAMASWMPSAMQLPIAVHELNHALQDQHFNLEPFLDYKKQPGDALLARSALVEGDATAVMIDYARELAGQKRIAEEESLSALMVQNLSGAMLSPDLQKAPSALQVLVLFPYVSGLNFVHAALRKGGYSAVNDIYRRPPATTEEILHPQKYFSGRSDSTKIDLEFPDDVVGFDGESAVYGDVMGEFIVSTLLSQWIPPQRASIAASGWGGDYIALYRSKSSGKTLLNWKLRWDSRKDAKEFADALTEAYTKRFSQGPETESGVTVYRNKKPGLTRIKTDDQEVTLLIECD